MKGRESRAAARRHRLLMSAASHIVSRHSLYDQVEQAAPAELAALVFGRHALRIDDEEALDYLNAVLAERGFPLIAAQPPLTGTPVIPAQRDSNEGEDQ
ncbi:hypothetical protein [Streptomyces pseudovenezuelae]|uniref:hypothetical protein n=1 Tax=Streptomyces pseudovenezuelae TaxID=67350 RepID=UPI0036EBB49D